jgi:hypothetical protein
MDTVCPYSLHYSVDLYKSVFRYPMVITLQLKIVGKI